MTYDKSLQTDFKFKKTLLGSKGSSIALIDDSMFTTNDKEKCFLTKFILKETSPTPYGLSQKNCSLPITSEDCRSIVVQTDTARIKGVKPNELTYEMIIENTVGGSIKINGSIEVLCSK